MGKVKVIVMLAVLLFDIKLLYELKEIGRVVFSNAKENTAEHSLVSGYSAYMRPGDWLLFVLADDTKGGVRLDSATHFKIGYSFWTENNPKIMFHGKLFFFWRKPLFDLSNTQTIFHPATGKKLFFWSPPLSLDFNVMELKKVAIYTGNLPVESKTFLSPSLSWQQVDYSPHY